MRATQLALPFPETVSNTISLQCLRALAIQTERQNQCFLDLFGGRGTMQWHPLCFTLDVPPTFCIFVNLHPQPLGGTRWPRGNSLREHPLCSKTFAMKSGLSSNTLAGHGTNECNMLIPPEAAGQLQHLHSFSACSEHRHIFFRKQRALLSIPSSHYRQLLHRGKDFFDICRPDWFFGFSICWRNMLEALEHFR